MKIKEVNDGMYPYFQLKLLEGILEEKRREIIKEWIDFGRIMV